MVVCPSSHILRRVNLCLVVFGCVVCLPFQIKNFAPCKCFAEIHTHTHTRAQIGCVLKTKKNIGAWMGGIRGGFRGVAVYLLVVQLIACTAIMFLLFFVSFFFCCLSKCPRSFVCMSVCLLRSIRVRVLVVV